MEKYPNTRRPLKKTIHGQPQRTGQLKKIMKHLKGIYILYWLNSKYTNVYKRRRKTAINKGANYHRKLFVFKNPNYIRLKNYKRDYHERYKTNPLETGVGSV